MTEVSSSELPKAIVSHSVLHPEFIAQQMVARYGEKKKPEVFLLHRGMNDVYLVQCENTRYAARVWRKTYRDVDDVAYELSFLSFLKEKHFNASAPVPLADGSLYFKADTPEGYRAIAVYEWAPGTKFGEKLSEDTAHKIGAGFAQMHKYGLEWAGQNHIFSTKTAKDFFITLPALLDFVYDRPDDLRDYPIIADNLAKRFDELHTAGARLGVCHRDFHPSNVHVDDNQNIVYLDFDAAGEDFLMQDVQNYVWGNEFYGFSAAYGEAFEAGYESVLPFLPIEKESKEVFLVGKALRLVAGMAESSKAVGRGTLRFRSLDWLGEYIKSRAVKLDLL